MDYEIKFTLKYGRRVQFASLTVFIPKLYKCMSINIQNSSDKCKAGSCRDALWVLSGGTGWGEEGVRFSSKGGQREETDN